MPHRFPTVIAIALFLSFAFSSCSYMTTQGRREAAYRRYVNKHVRQREKQTAKAQKAAQRRARHQMKSQPPIENQPIVSSGVESADQVSRPMTVSSSETGEAPITEPAP